MVDGRWDICEQIVHENTHSAIAVTCWLEMWNSIFNYGRYHFSIRELFQYLSVLVIKELSMKSFDKKSSSDIKFKSETFKSSCIRSAFINNKVFILNILDRLWYLPTPTNNSAVPGEKMNPRIPRLTYDFFWFFFGCFKEWPGPFRNIRLGKDNHMF